MSVTLNKDKEQCAEQNKRINKLERVTDRHTDSIARIETDLQGAWTEIEGFKTRENNNAVAWAVLCSEHEECKPKVEVLKDHVTGVDFRLKTIEERYLANKSLWSSILGNTLSSLIWYLVCFLAGAIVLWGGKGLLKL